MSGNEPTSGNERSTDKRILRTRERLGDALVALLHEKPFEAITVQDVLDRAGVGRSTFYAHFADKDDLLLSDVDEFFERLSMHLARTNAPSERVAPVSEFFEHVAGMHRFRSALRAAGKLDQLMQLGQGHFARGIAARLATLPRARGLAPARRAALSEAFAGSLLALLSWWLGRGTPESPAEIDALFHDMVWSAVDPARASRALDGRGAAGVSAARRSHSRSR